MVVKLLMVLKWGAKYPKLQLACKLLPCVLQYWTTLNYLQLRSLTPCVCVQVTQQKRTNHGKWYRQVAGKLWGSAQLWAVQHILLGRATLTVVASKSYSPAPVAWAKTKYFVITRVMTLINIALLCNRYWTQTKFEIGPLKISMRAFIFDWKGGLRHHYENFLITGIKQGFPTTQGLRKGGIRGASYPGPVGSGAQPGGWKYPR